MQDLIVEYQVTKTFKDSEYGVWETNRSNANLSKISCLGWEN